MRIRYPVPKETSPMNKKTYEKHFAKRGISREVAEARPHGRYRQGHPEDIWKWDPKYHDLLTSPQRGAVTRNVNQSAGTVMVRYTVSQAENAEALFGPMWAELRPDEAIMTGRRTHSHPDPSEYAEVAERAKFERKSRSHIDRGNPRKPKTSLHRGLLTRPRVLDVEPAVDQMPHASPLQARSPGLWGPSRVRRKGARMRRAKKSNPHPGVPAPSHRLARDSLWCRRADPHKVPPGLAVPTMASGGLTTRPRATSL